MCEMMSVLSSQLTRAILIDKELLTEEEKSMIVEYIPQYSNYKPRITDDVKNTFNSELFKEDLAKFIVL